MLNVCLPGTGSVYPTGERWLSCCTLSYNGHGLLIDCGEGTQIALRQTSFHLSKLNYILLTHYHADHVSGLPGLLLTLGNMGKDTPLTIVGPKGLHGTVAGLRVIAPVLPYDIRLLEVSGQGDVQLGDFHINYLPLSHGIPTMGYSVAIHRKPIFNPEKAKALGLPPVLNKVLHAGQSVVLTDGRVVEPCMVLDGERPSLKVCYITDSAPTETMVELAKNATLLIGEGMYCDENMGQKMLEKGHMLFTDSAKLARRANVQTLWLTHYSPALREIHMEQTLDIFQNTLLSYDGIQTVLR